MNQPARKQFFKFHNGEKSTLPFSQGEYQARMAGLRRIMSAHNLDAVLLTSMHNIAYYSGFLYCAFGRPYALVVTENDAVTISANIDGGQPWRRSACDNLLYTDWQRDNFWRAVQHVIGQPARLGIEADHLTLQQSEKLMKLVQPATTHDICAETMQQRMVKSDEERAIIRMGAAVADIGGTAIIEAVQVGVREIDVAMAGRNAIEQAITELAPESEIRDNWVWFQSGINTDGAHNPVTCKRVDMGEILSLNAFSMISGYYTALERTLWMGEPDADSLRIWQANVGAHELGLSLIKPGITCAEICEEINRYFSELDLLQYRSFGYGHSFGVLSHYYGREIGLELREDVHTKLEPGMVVSMEPMLTIPNGQPGAGGYREHDILIVGDQGAENITKTPYGPAHNIL